MAVRLIKELRKGKLEHFGTLRNDRSLTSAILNEKLVCFLILPLSCDDVKFRTDTDASDHQAGCVSLQ